MVKYKYMKFRQELFWDVDPKTIDKNKHSQYIIERILEMGRKEEIKWLLQNFDKKTIKETLMKRKGFTVKTANFWRLFFNIPKNKILCLSKQYQQMRKTHWPY